MPPRPTSTYQVNSTYYSALGCNDQHYLAARAVQFFLPGVPQVYYVGALAGRNDMELLRRTNNGRDINRHYYSTAEIDENLERPVVKALNALAKFRNELPAFDGEFSYEVDGDTSITFRWTAADGTSTAALTFEPRTRPRHRQRHPGCQPCLERCPPATTKPAICSPTRRLPISTNRWPINATPLCALQVVRPA